MPEPEKDPREAKWELINAEQATRLDRQGQSLARIETKPGVVATFALAGGQFLATRHPFATSWSTLLGVLAFACYVVTAGCSIWVTRVARGADLTRAQVLQRLIVSRVEVYKRNNGPNAKRARVWWHSVWVLSAGFLCSVACIMLTA
ncbi:MAG: hypothetical protein GEV28_11855 [Actinophytocola sp.]|uniref:hypothetical protein n=1 Tax=Actinophytocola sp. TaxID=1872138 RepID=UPI00132686AB|nr:hypothetical protein [Actinophytocola sp.]MPZ81043.1 hypothetical protein [Actinophytocola sp.]